jgi:hypothetical protein
MARLIEEEGLKEVLVRNGRVHVQAFTWRAVGPQWLEIYREVRA